MTTSFGFREGYHLTTDITFNHNATNRMSPKITHRMSPKITHRMSPKITHRMSPKITHTFGISQMSRLNAPCSPINVFVYKGHKYIAYH